MEVWESLQHGFSQGRKQQLYKALPIWALSYIPYGTKALSYLWKGSKPITHRAQVRPSGMW